MKDGTCPKCSATAIIPGISLLEYGHHNSQEPLSVKVAERPGHWLDPRTHTYNLRAWICVACGYTELYVDDPQGLYATYQAFEQRQQ